jgi:allantoate deiminase
VSGTAADVLTRAAVLAAISEEPDRLTRRFATPALARAGELVAGWMEAAGLAVRRDAAGNVIGSAGDGTPLVLGSHIDTVPNAGRFDGPLGVLAAIAVAERLAAETARMPSLEVVAFADEEGARFGVPYLGSAAYLGRFDPLWLELVDADGITLAEAVTAAGGDPAALVAASTRDLAGYVEVHIEQGPILERDGLPVGVVTAIAGQTRASVTLRGAAGHAGTLPMAGRRDALAAAAEVVLAVEQAGRSQEGLVATVGALTVSPGASNVVPGQVTLSVDVRHAADELRTATVASVREGAEGIASSRGIELEWSVLQDTAAVRMAPELVERMRAAVAAEGHAVRELVSGAGHDAVVLSRVCSSVMLFVRCAGGISHDPRESVSEPDVSVALDVLERVVRSFG